jgi:hypothetical protein
MKPLAQTPPMGWNSWNAFEQKIDEQKIQEIADAMVTSGMRDVGYRYLVLDDGWLAKERDSKGNLIADPVKFPSGMQAIGDYIHHKGLLFGIYEDRGRLTCQGLAGSFQHEQADMSTFATWGVDYIKLDSCYAEHNKRLSSVDYTLYRDAIRKTGRPMLLSISDFGNGAWTWGGEKIGQLWRTSMDIYPDIDSVYYCAETSGGDEAIHPAFNGLGQFASPGHWNDPDMLQVGNLTSEVESRTHFALWCILAAPLMAGNDLRMMSASVQSILTAPEVVQVNQDPRGIQGFRVFKEGEREIYNKPLADGTTAVLLLNKGSQPADITVSWSQIGLAGRGFSNHQNVRDLWARQDIGVFAESFTARRLGQHEHVLIKVGSRGRPLSAPKPLPESRYVVATHGITYLSDLCYIWKNSHAPISDKNAQHEPLLLAGKPYAKGLGCLGKSVAMYKLNGHALRFTAWVGLDAANTPEAEGRFRVMEEDFFGNTILFDSGNMRRDTPPVRVDVGVKNKNCLLLEFTNRKGDNILGNWAEAQVIGRD